MPHRVRRLMALLRCTLRNWHADNASNTGAALAFYCAFSLAPLLVILLSLAATLLGTDRAYSEIGGQLTALFGAGTAKVLLEAITSAQHAEGLSAMIISAVTLLIGSTTVLAALEAALERIWQGEAPRRLGYRDWLKTRVLSLAFILALGFLLLVSLTISTGLASMRTHVSRHYAAWAGAFGALDFAAALLVVALLFALIYRYVPAHRLRWTTVLACSARNSPPASADSGRSGERRAQRRLPVRPVPADPGGAIRGRPGWAVRVKRLARRRAASARTPPAIAVRGREVGRCLRLLVFASPQDCARLRRRIRARTRRE